MSAFPGFSRRRRRRLGGVRTVSVTASGGTYGLAIDGAPCGAGTFSQLSASCSPAPTGGPVALDFSPDGGSPALEALIAAGTTTGSDAASASSIANAAVDAATGAGNTVTISGTVHFVRASDSAVFNFALQPFVLPP